MGEGLLQRLIMELLRPLLARFLADAGKVASVGADQFIYYKKGDPHARIAPDVYVLPGVPPSRRIRSWKIWEEGFPPSFCFEVVSEDVRHDYEEKPILYRETGTRELVIFDPDSAGHPDRYRWQVYRQVKGRGLVRVEVAQGDRVRSKELGLWLRQIGEGDAARVRPASGKDGELLMPTPEEREQAQREAKEREREAKEREREAKEREREAKEREREAKEREREAKEREREARLVAEREVALLREEIASLRRAAAPAAEPRASRAAPKRRRRSP